MGRYYRYRGWEDDRGQVWRCRKPDGWPTDNKAPDGFTVNGYRRVRKDNTILFLDTRWTHAKIKSGDMLFVILEGALGEAVSGLIVSPRWNPDNIGDDWRTFVHESWLQLPDYRFMMHEAKRQT
jgi:hypothetical protein